MIKLKKLIKEDINSFNRIVDSEGLNKIVSGRDGLVNTQRKVSDIFKLTRDVKAYIPVDDEYKSHRRMWRKLHKDIDEAADNLDTAASELQDLKKRYYNWVESVKKVKK